MCNIFSTNIDIILGYSQRFFTVLEIGEIPMKFHQGRAVKICIPSMNLKPFRIVSKLQNVGPTPGLETPTPVYESPHPGFGPPNLRQNQTNFTNLGYRRPNVGFSVPNA